MDFNNQDMEIIQAMWSILQIKADTQDIHLLIRINRLPINSTIQTKLKVMLIPHLSVEVEAKPGELKINQTTIIIETTLRTHLLKINSQIKVSYQIIQDK